jgi:lipid A 3-O-deacylase
MPDSIPCRAATAVSQVRRLLVATVGTTLLAALGLDAQGQAYAAAAPSSPGGPGPAAASEWSAALRWENDTFGGSDRFYTNGASLGLSQTGKNWLDPLADALPWGDGRRTVGYDLTQLMMTPENISLRIPEPDDRPYAGVLALGLALHVEREESYHGLRLMTGVVGPLSVAEDTQRIVHRLVDGKTPHGWDYQLENEPILNLGYEYRRKVRLAGEPDGWACEGLPTAGAMAGNAFTNAYLGGLLRVGYNMPDDYGTVLARATGHLPPPRPRPGPGKPPSWGFALHAGGVANLVLRDITLDGNTFEDSPSVDHRPFVPAASIGLTVGDDRLLTSFSYIFWGKEFEGQREHSEYGTLGVTYRF